MLKLKKNYKNNNMKTSKKQIIFLVLFLIISLSCAGALYFTSQHSPKITIKPKLLTLPEKMMIYGKPGDKIKSKFTVVNNGYLPVVMKISAKDFTLASENGKVNFAINDAESVSSWILPQYLKVFIWPYQKKDIGFIVQIPKDAQPKGYRGAIVFEAASSKMVGPSKSFGLVIPLNVLKEDPQNNLNGLVKILSFSPKKSDNGQMQFNLKVVNNSNENLLLGGTVSLKNLKKY